MRLLFVCTGNICRSPTAERLAYAYSAKLGIPCLEASSAGTRAVSGAGIQSEAAVVLRRLGGDPTGFQARQITPRIASDADIVVAMTREQRETVLDLAPRQMRRTFTLAEAADLVSNHDARTVAEMATNRHRANRQQLDDIEDPIGRSAEVYADVGNRIASLVSTLVANLPSS